MTQQPTVRQRWRRASSMIATAALAGATLVGLGTAAPAQAAPTPISNASLTWGLNGYAQVGIFGPWIFKDVTGNVTQLVGSVSGGSQTEYVVDPVPATSMPVSTPQKTPNAVKFTAGTGTADPDTGVATLSWTGSYTVNAYPPQYNAPNEIYSNPQLTVAADGSGQLTMNFALGAGEDMGGTPTPAQDFGRVTLLTFDAGSSARTEPDAFRLTPDYQGVEVTLPDGSAQVRNCTTDGGATGWWGSWPQEFVSVIPGSVRPHFYSTGCSGMQDYKPALPLDLDLNTTPEVTVSKTTLLPNGAQQVTVTGSGFYPELAIGTRPPLSGKPAGSYVVFGRFAEVWKPSAGAPTSARPNSEQKWAVPAESIATIGGAAAGAIELTPQGTFSTTLTIDKAAIDAKASTGNYGIYTYPGSGAVQPLYETYTPITFAKAKPTVSISAKNPTYGVDVPVTVKVTADSGPTGEVTLKDGNTVVGTAPVSNGAASFTLAKPGAGAHALTASYAGDGNTEAGSAAATLTVAKAAAGKVKVTVKKKPTTKKKGKLVVKLGKELTGKVKLVVKPAKGKAIKTIKKSLKVGVAKFNLPKLKPGVYQLKLSYGGDANTLSTSKVKKLRVK